MAQWAPNAEGLAAIATLFLEYSQPSANQAEIYGRLQQCSAVPDFNNYLAFLLSQATVRLLRGQLSDPAGSPGLQDKPLEVRQSAGLLLKNNLRQHWDQLQPHVKAYVKARSRPSGGASAVAHAPRAGVPPSVHRPA
jgi:transportin-1